MVHCAAAERCCTCSAGGREQQSGCLGFFLFSDLFPGKSVEGVTGVVLKEAAAGVGVEKGSVCLKTVENLVSLVPGELATGLVAEESTLTAHSRGSVGRPQVDGRR